MDTTFADRTMFAPATLLSFVKMHGLGNDFVVFDGVRQKISLSAEQLRWLGDRHRGIGCDQILLVEPPRDPAMDFRYRIFNADGGEVEQCGNGARCFARFVRAQGLSSKPVLRVETARGRIMLEQLPDGQVRVDMGAPIFRAECLPFVPSAVELSEVLGLPASASSHTGSSRPPADAQMNTRGQRYRLRTLEDAWVSFDTLAIGNPHAVIWVDAVDSAPLERWGPWLQAHPAFPAQVNVGFAERVDRQHLRLRVFERGVGETLACGSGACAAVVAGIGQQRLDATVTVKLRGGDLQISWAGDDAPVYMTGPASFVFEGQVRVPELGEPRSLPSPKT